MAGITEEAAGICEHTVEGADCTQIHKAGHLIRYAGFVVIEPPGSALLDFPGDSAVR